MPLYLDGQKVRFCRVLKLQILFVPNFTIVIIKIPCDGDGWSSFYFWLDETMSCTACTFVLLLGNF